MSLSASLFSGISGLQAHGEKMSVLGNNIANVNTVGFKSAKMFFQDAISQDFPTAAGIAQVGRGTQIGAIYGDFSQGSFETTSESTDLAIGGNGFFIVKAKGEETTYYTRAGNFRFDKDGYLVDPHGYVLQGWEVQSSSTTVATANTTSSNTSSVRLVGTPTDIRLENFQSPPQATSQVSIITNLDSASVSNTNNSSNPYFALAQLWDGTADTPMPDTAYNYQTTIKVYDGNGSAHNVTTYFDAVTMSNAGGVRVFEYIVTCQPSDDGRYLSDGAGNVTRMNQTSAAGLLMMGTLTFNAAGDLIGQSSYTLRAVSNGGPKALENWGLAKFSTTGYPITTANFLGQSNASLPDSTNAAAMQFNFGIKNKDLSSNGAGLIGWNQTLGTIASNASMVVNTVSSAGVLPSFKEVERSALSSTSYSSGSTTLYQSQDGYTAGFLQNVSVDRDGVLTGRYSNGQILELYALTLADFNNRWGLRREGGNLFSETRESGPALTGRPNSGGKGSIASNSLEQSNVDMATEFVQMITTQRGFQANSKVITTADSMLGELIALKR